MSETETVEKLEPAVVRVKSQRRIHPSRFKLAESDRNVWRVIPEAGTSIETVLGPDYWANIASKLRPGDRIEVDAEDGAWTATLFVRSASRLAAVVALLFKMEFAVEDAKPLSDDFRVTWKGMMHKFAVIRVTDEKTILQGGFVTKEDGLKWLALNARSLAA